MKSNKTYAIDENKNSLLDLPQDLLQYVIPSVADNVNGTSHEATHMMAALSNTNRTLYTLFQPELEKRAAKQLLTYVLQGNADKAKAMYSVNPSLLFIEATAKDYAEGIDADGKAVHRTIVASPYRAALGAKDIWMLADMQQYLDKIVDKKRHLSGRQIAAEQFHQQFPNGWENTPSTYNFSALVTAITNDQTLIQTGKANSATEAALVQFRKDFIPDVVSVGEHFNMNDLIQACKVYNKNRRWHVNQLSLFWCQVIGYLQRLVSACDAQALSQGVANVDDGKPSQRNLALLNNATNLMTAYFPLDRDPKARLGFDFAVYSYYSGAGYQHKKRAGACLSLQHYIESKKKTWENLSKSHDNKQTYTQ